MKTAKWLASKVEKQYAGGTVVKAGDINPKFFNQVAQFAHFGMMFAVTTFLIIVAGKFGHVRCGFYGSFVVVLTYASWHEFIWDPTHENAATRGSDWEDWGFLMAGMIAAIILLIWAH
jgi:hypothetical protein